MATVDGEKILGAKQQAAAAEGGSSRVHVVLVPGFGGFDALGQINYYRRTTETAADWRAAADGGQRLVLHYFDNLPTAGVDTRAERLLRYLVARVERNEFQKGDTVALIGHSTGGLDIRRLLCELFAIHHTPVWEKTTERPEPAALTRLRTMIKRVVFMSVPQRGTNIANWTRDMTLSRMLLLGYLRFHYDVVDMPGFETLDTAFWRRLQALRLNLPEKVQNSLEAWLPDLYQAIFDVNTEAALRADDDAILAAKGRESLSQLNLYLNQTQSDFLAINDLAVEDANRWDLRKLVRGFVRPATEAAENQRLSSLDAQARQRELDAWQANNIEVLSFATVATSPLAASHTSNADKLAGIRALLQIIPMPWRKSDGPFRLAYRACATGPFARSVSQLGDSEPDALRTATRFATDSTEQHGLVHIEPWENDGIVNTASMLWPNGSATRLVLGDHADIIGHFGPALEAKDKNARKFAAYDIFGSDSGFDKARFEKIWFEAFTHCMPEEARSLPQHAGYEAE